MDVLNVNLEDDLQEGVAVGVPSDQMVEGMVDDIVISDDGAETESTAAEVQAVLEIAAPETATQPAAQLRPALRPVIWR